MSPQKKIGRWNRLEIALAERGWPQTSPFRASEDQDLDKMQNLSKIGAPTTNVAPLDLASESTTATPAGEPQTREKQQDGPTIPTSPTTPGASSPKESPSATETSPSLWTAARRQTEARQKRADQALKSEQSTKSPPFPPTPPLPPRRPRTFRASEPPRRFKRPDDEQTGNAD